MLCDKCHKKDAKILYTEIINGIKKEQHLCEECATNYTSFQMENPLYNNELTLGDILSTLLEAYNTGSTNAPGDKIKGPICANCNTSYQEFLKQGMFGCSQCYNSFYKEINRTIKGIQGADTHTGKQPRGYVDKTTRILNEMSQLDKLSLRLQEAVEREEYEEAARLRDRIRDIKKEEANNA